METIRVGFIFSDAADAALLGQVQCMPRQRFAHRVLGAAVTAGLVATGGKVRMDDIPNGLRRRVRLRIEVPESVQEYLAGVPGELRGMVATALLKAGWEERLVYQPEIPKNGG